MSGAGTRFGCSFMQIATYRGNRLRALYCRGNKIHNEAVEREREEEAKEELRLAEIYAKIRRECNEQASRNSSSFFFFPLQ